MILLTVETETRGKMASSNYYSFSNTISKKSRELSSVSRPMSLPHSASLNINNLVIITVMFVASCWAQTAKLFSYMSTTAALKAAHWNLGHI